jgi:hypothetical protein
MVAGGVATAAALADGSVLVVLVVLVVLTGSPVGLSDAAPELEQAATSARQATVMSDRVNRDVMEPLLGTRPRRHHPRRR